MTRRCYEDVVVGKRMAPLFKSPLKTAHMACRSAAMENWHDIHYHRKFAVGHDEPPDPLMNATSRPQFILQLLRD